MKVKDIIKFIDKDICSLYIDSEIYDIIKDYYLLINDDRLINCISGGENERGDYIMIELKGAIYG